MKPRHIAYIIWTIIVLLGVVCLLVPDDGFSLGQYTLRWPTLAEALDLKEDTIQRDDFGCADDSILVDMDTMGVLATGHILERDTAVLTDTIQKKSQPVVPNVDIVNTDLRAYLSAFYAALDSADTMPVRVVHYGDSQIEEDRITNVLRERWQKLYGGGGVGLLPLHQTIPTQSIRQWLSIDGVVQTTQGGPKRYLIYGPRSMRLSTDNYGVMGQLARLDTLLVPGSDSLVVNIEPLSSKRYTYNYFNRLRLLSDSILGFVLANDTTYHLSACSDSPIALADSTTRCEIHLHGCGNVYGISLETPTGVLVDNIPMRGCSGNIFTRIDSAALSHFYHTTNTRLIILQFGGNMIPQTENPSTLKGYVTTLRRQVRYMRSLAPQASILFIGPSDMSTRIDGQLQTYPLLPYLDQLLQQMAQQEHIAYWSIYEAMGGHNSMITWHDKGLAGSDYVHFTRSGANRIGRQLYDWLHQGKQQHSTVTPTTTDSI